MSNRRAIVAILVVVALGSATASVGIAGAQSTTGIDSCTTIDSSGSYTLTSNLSTESDDCLRITASHVTLDGNGHGVDGGSSGVGVVVTGPERLSDVTVRGMHTEGFTRGILFRNVDSGTIADSTAIGATEGITLLSTDDTTVTENTVRENALGIELRKASDNTIADNTANDNKYGLHIERASIGNRFVNDTATGNSLWDFYSDRFDPGTDSQTTVKNLDMGAVTADLSGTNVGVHAQGEPDSAPSGRTAVGTAVRTTDYGEGSNLSLSLHYDDASGVDESSLALWSSPNGDSWSKLDGSTVNTEANTVSADGVPHPATIGVFGRSENGTSNATAAAPQTATATATPTTTTAATATATATSTTTTAATATPGTASTTDPEATSIAAATTAVANASETSANGTTTSSTTGPGFGPVGGLLALCVAGLLAVRFGRRR
ncbi:NosD domain-containing protein [Halococcus qingdaonensis]|uniref:NosD domain-containing protein n=1 Tax=Halococcus qingdaonensis TaxID=224402 RepID=UPI002115D825|nr:NosD domain-containing protein [Halococcus qingdaonensis]